jgi:hypothetical protein
MREIEEYLNLLGSQYREKERYIKTVRGLLQPLHDIDVTLSGWPNHFNLNDAVGAQLDILGERAGRSRRLDFQPQGASALMDDETYRFALRAKIAQNMWDGTISGIEEILAACFPNNEFIIHDNQDMSMKVELIGLESSLAKQLFRRGYIAPKPAGVRLSVETSTIQEIDFTLRSAVNCWGHVGQMRLPAVNTGV